MAITALDPVISVTKTPSVAPIAEPGGTVSYTVQITNDGVEPVTVSSLTDSLEGWPRGRRHHDRRRPQRGAAPRSWGR
ncbi:MAG: hypothetical protein R2701_06670 [Acidimicrobiales bacterium]